MNKIIVTLFLTLVLGLLTACQNQQMASAIHPSETMAQRYQGVLPCADCEGIQSTLALQEGGRYQLSELYLGSNDVYQQQGTWTRTAEKLVLISEQGNKRYFRPVGNELEMMDTEGNPINSENNYRLTPIAVGN
ncbi:hypothetical protein ED28_18265 [[Pantoea] beijingensis]|uniref:Copper homeostasis protein n=1 Tax=[Pantoea] beijingensis TaxID=1324864 RepID=A0A443I8I1_9GAMM|nr:MULTISPECIES: copper resistance protein NlpE N-terminal domain-containing protein [Erwiniaceae]RWR00431.1 hypothetical protein ED28_18265 [[Pantoea] beijingensis]